MQQLCSAFLQLCDCNATFLFVNLSASSYSLASHIGISACAIGWQMPHMFNLNLSKKYSEDCLCTDAEEEQHWSEDYSDESDFGDDFYGNESWTDEARSKFVDYF